MDLPSIPEVVEGIYLHFKGGLYWVSGEIEWDEEDHPRFAYYPLYHTWMRKRSRLANKFVELVDAPQGKVPRFTLLVPTPAKYLLIPSSNVIAREKCNRDDPPFVRSLVAWDTVAEVKRQEKEIRVHLQASDSSVEKVVLLGEYLANYIPLI